MNEPAETKVCPFCAETIKAAAKKCPWCNSRLYRFALFRQELAMGFACLMLFGFFIFVCAWLLPDDSDGSHHHFQWHRKDLEVKNVNVTVERRETNEYNYAVTGMVTNKGVYSWRVEEFELIVTNTQRIADVVHVRADNSFVIQPGTEHAFVFHKWTSLTNPVIAAQARVENARDGNALEKGDNFPGE